MRTQKTIPEPDSPSHILGAPVYRKTGCFELAFPMKAAWGRVPSEQMLYYMRGGRCVRRQLVCPSDPKTALQLGRRINFGEAQHRWSTLSEEQRQGWEEYALKHFFRREEVASVHKAGLNAWCKTQVYRVGMSGEFGTSAPSHGVPPALLGIWQEPSAQETSFAFRIDHPLRDLTGMRVLVEITRAMPSTRRKPRECELRWAAEEGRCFLPLKPAGELYLLEGARYAVSPGERYGVRMKLVSEEGVPGPELTADFIRGEYALPAQTGESGA